MKTITIDKENSTATIKLSLEKIKFNKQRRMYYYEHDAKQWILEEGLEPLKCLKTCTADNVNNVEGEWIFKIKLTKPKAKTSKVLVENQVEEIVEQVAVEQVVVKDEVESELEKPLRRRRRVLRKDSEKTE